MSVEQDEKSESMRISWADGHVSHFHWLWLADNDARWKDASSGQKLNKLPPLDARPRRYQITPNELEVEWMLDIMKQSRYQWAWLRAHCYSAESRFSRRRRQEQARTRWEGESLSLPQYEYKDVIDSDSGRWSWAQSLARYGLALVRNVPLERAAFIATVQRLGPLKDNMYGQVFDVRSEDSAINVAYTGLELDAHTDLSVPPLFSYPCVTLSQVLL